MIECYVVQIFSVPQLNVWFMAQFKGYIITRLSEIQIMYAITITVLYHNLLQTNVPIIFSFFLVRNKEYFLCVLFLTPCIISIKLSLEY